MQHPLHPRRLQPPYNRVTRKPISRRVPVLRVGREAWPTPVALLRAPAASRGVGCAGVPVVVLARGFAEGAEAEW
jgi:hypothetical protein